MAPTNRMWRGITCGKIEISPNRAPSVSAVRMPHSAMPKTGRVVASRAACRPGSLNQAMT
jgi:hypothetical protein